MNRFHRIENELKTVVDHWSKRIGTTTTARTGVRRI